jgi:hypothetical protein
MGTPETANARRASNGSGLNHFIPIFLEEFWRGVSA